MKPIDEVRRMLADLVGGPDTPFMERRAQAEKFAAAFVKPSDIEIEPGELDAYLPAPLRLTDGESLFSA